MSRRRKNPSARRKPSIRDSAAEVWPMVSAPLHWHLRDKDRMPEAEWMMEAANVLLGAYGIASTRGSSPLTLALLDRCRQALAKAHLTTEVSECMKAMDASVGPVQKTYAETGERTRFLSEFPDHLKSWSEELWQRGGTALKDDGITAEELAKALVTTAEFMEQAWPDSGETLHFTADVWKEKIEPGSFPSEHLGMN